MNFFVGFECLFFVLQFNVVKELKVIMLIAQHPTYSLSIYYTIQLGSNIIFYAFFQIKSDF